MQDLQLTVSCVCLPTSAACFAKKQDIELHPLCHHLPVPCANAKLCAPAGNAQGHEMYLYFKLSHRSAPTPDHLKTYQTQTTSPVSLLVNKRGRPCAATCKDLRNTTRVCGEGLREGERKGLCFSATCAGQSKGCLSKGRSMRLSS